MYFLAGGFIVVFVMALLYYVVKKTVVFIWAYFVKPPKSFSNEENVEPEIIVTLVHGTFARYAAWTDYSSELCISLVKSTKCKIRFERFFWTGANSIISRRKSADRLAGHLHACIRKWPKADNFIIGHSHGGQIAFYALEDPWLREHTKGLICLSTPFLSVLPRKIGRLALIGITCTPFLMIFIAFAKMQTDSSTILTISVLTVGLITSLLFWYSLKKLRVYIPEATRYPLIDSDNVLLIRTIADEASAIISFSYLVSRLMGGISGFLNSTIEIGFDIVEQWRAVLLSKPILYTLSLLCCAVYILYNLFTYPDAGNYPDGLLMYLQILCLMYVAITLGIITTGGLLIALTLPIFLAFIASPFVAISALCGLAVGTELMIAGILFHISAEATPPGRWNVWQLEPSNKEGEANLFHSMSYTDINALNLISAWFSERINTKT